MKIRQRAPQAERLNNSRLLTPSPPHPFTPSLPSLLLHLALLVLALLSLTPFAWLLCASFKNQADLFSWNFLPWPHLHNLLFDKYLRPSPLHSLHAIWTGLRMDLARLTLDNYRALLSNPDQPFFRWLLNSLFLASLQTAITVTLSSLGGFALAKYRFAGKKFLMLIMLGTLLLPSQVLLASTYELIWHFGWLNSYLAILVPGAVSVFGMFLFKQAMTAVPDELLAAARVDGCSELRLWWEIALPIVRPMIGAFTLLSFLGSWNSFLWPQVVLQDPARYTLPIGLASMTGLAQYQQHYGILMAGTLLSILPIAVLFFILQRDFIAGLASGAVKG